MDINPEILKKLQALQEKYDAMGQDMNSYLDGLLYSDYLTYWQYINLDALLGLQQPKTSFPDEQTFIMYHQITELYFKLILEAISVVARARNSAKLDLKLLKRQLLRINNYFEHLVSSFSIMIDGMEPEQFLKFRMALLPASGFQSAQYRMIEICSCEVHRLIHFRFRDELAAEKDHEKILAHLYWKQGATELATGKKTLTLRQFEEKYKAKFLKLMKDQSQVNLWACYKSLPEKDQQDEELVSAMKRHDILANVNWPIQHLKSASRYLIKKSDHIKATGGTNWQDYLPPKNQRVIFYPDLWTDAELDDWGKRLL